MWLLLIGLIVLLLISYYLNLKEAMAPSFLFVASFIFCLTWAIAYKDKWDTVLDSKTGIVIFVGCLEYVAVATIVRTLINKGKLVQQSYGEIFPLEINRMKIHLFLLFEIAVMVIYAYAIRRVTGVSNLGAAIQIYRQTMLVSDTKYVIPKIFNYLRLAANAGGYWFAYVLARNLFTKKSFDVEVFLIIIISSITFTFTGGRNGAVNQILAFLGTYLILGVKEKGTGKVLKFRQLLLIVILAVAGLLGFQQIGMLLGRTVKRSIFDYLALYCGGEIHILNRFITQRLPSLVRDSWGSQTFRNIVVPINKLLGVKDYYVFYDAPRIYSNGYYLGNVGTTFYSLLYDFNYVGCFIMVAVMSAVNQGIYEACKRELDSFYPPMIMLIYGYIFNATVYAFFSNWFFEEIANVSFIYYIIFWLLFSFFFCGRVAGKHVFFVIRRRR